MLRKTVIDFSQTLQDWDGFGINYVETAQTRDYQADPQEYGGFSTLSKEDRQEIVELIFGDDGLTPCTCKMFHDCWHQPEPGPGYNWDPNAIDPAAYDHDTTTQWMRYFVREGLKRTRARGDDLAIILPPVLRLCLGFLIGVVQSSNRPMSLESSLVFSLLGVAQPALLGSSALCGLFSLIPGRPRQRIEPARHPLE